MKIVIVLAILLMTTFSNAADLTLKWEASSGATGYRIYMSIDLGVTWLAPKDVGNVLTYIYLTVPDTTLVLFRLGAYNAAGEQLTSDRGCWYDGRKSLPKMALHFGAM